MSYFDDMYYESLEDDLYEEGANLDIRAILSDNKKIIRSNIAQAKKAIKAGDYDVAKKAIKDAKVAIEGAKKEISKIDSTWGSAAFSIAVDFAMITATTIATTLLTEFGISISDNGVAQKVAKNAKVTGNVTKNLAGFTKNQSGFKNKLAALKISAKLGGQEAARGVKDDAVALAGAAKVAPKKRDLIIVPAASAAATLIFQGIKVLKSLKNKEGVTAETFNTYKMVAMKALTNYSKACDKLQKACDEKKAAEKKAASKITSIFKKESADEVADIIEEAFMEDIIDADEMDTLLEAAYEGNEDDVIAYIESSMDDEESEEVEEVEESVYDFEDGFEDDTEINW